jgi:hypothetical protein
MKFIYVCVYRVDDSNKILLLLLLLLIYPICTHIYMHNYKKIDIKQGEIERRSIMQYFYKQYTIFIV